MTIKTPKKLIEVALPLDNINITCGEEKSIGHEHRIEPTQKLCFAYFADGESCSVV